MNHIDEIECICGTTVEISEFQLGLRGEPVHTAAPCPICGKVLYETDIDGIVLVEVIFPRGQRSHISP
ncbi:hypothetical protein [Cupriavidus campinensis]